MVNIKVNPERVLGKRDKMIYGQFIEHFHRQIYGGIVDPSSPFSDDNGFRRDVMEALKKITPSIIRWPGGCFVSSYHWRDGVGERVAAYDKAWRVEEPNTFGTDEFIQYCKLLDCEPYICTNGGTGTAQEMSDWVEYCNLPHEGQHAKQRIKNGSKEPYRVKYWSIGNENYGAWEIGAKTATEWSYLVREAAKMMKRVDPTIELSAAALPDVNWNLALLERAGESLDWISIHEYWDFPSLTNELASYEQVMALTSRLDTSIKKVEGILEATGYSDKIKISFDEWNLRGWYHPYVHPVMSADKEKYLTSRDKNDDNSTYTMADTIFTGCFLNTLLRHSNTVKMANYSPAVNTRGLIYTHQDGLVLRGTYHVFDLFVNRMGEEVIDLWQQESPEIEVFGRDGESYCVSQLDVVATRKDEGGVAVSIINKHPEKAIEVTISCECDESANWKLYTINGSGIDDYNDIERPDNIKITHKKVESKEGLIQLQIPPHSVNVLSA